MGSPRFNLNMDDVKTTLRHTVMPILAGAGVAALEAAQSGTVSFDTLKTAGLTALLSGVIRFLHRFTADNSQGT